MRLQRTTYHWPTEVGWVCIVGLCVMAAVAGGWFGFFLMLGFFSAASLLGNVLLP